MNFSVIKSLWAEDSHFADTFLIMGTKQKKTFVSCNKTTKQNLSEKKNYTFWSTNELFVK